MKQANDKSSLTLLSLIAILLALFTYGASAGHTGAESLDVLGKWRALSQAYVSLHGDMEIFQDRIFWGKHEHISYKVLEPKKDALFVELERAVDCGRYMRIGPMSKGRLEVAFYKTKDNLQMPKRPKLHEKDELEYEKGCSWGVYLK